MNPVLTILRQRPADSSADRQLLDRFLTAQDGDAFAELVRRYGPVVWGACRRRLASAQDAEDAFQATFLVLVRRAERLAADVPLGPWLYQVAVMTARNVARSNRRRAATAGPMGHEVPAPAGADSADKLDLDAVLLALSERDRAAVVLCHLEGLTRREAAERLGCPEGTLSARLSRALRRLRARLGDRGAAALAVAAVAVPAGLASATVRSATVYSTSTLTAAGVSPAVVGLTDGVLRMFWMKKATTAAVLAVFLLGAGVLALGMTGRSENVARAADRPEGAPPKAADDPDPLKRLEKRLADLEKQRELLDATLADIKAEKKKLEDAKREQQAAVELGKDLAVVVKGTGGKPTYTVREVVNEKIGELHCSDLGVLAKYLARTFNDPNGPKSLRIYADRTFPADQLKKVFEACAAAGYKKAALFEKVSITTYQTYLLNNPLSTFGTTQLGGTTNSLLGTKSIGLQPGTSLMNSTIPYTTQRIEIREIDLTKHANPQKP